MKWFRSNIQHGSRIALFALAIQFVLSFGHFHADAARAVSAVPSGPAHSDVSYANGLPAADAVARQQPASNHDSDQQPDDYCSICAVIALANAVLFATPPALPLPQAVAFLYLATGAAFVHLNSVSVAFQPRAPPVS